MQYTNMLKTWRNNTKEFLIQHSSFNSWKPTVKLDLGEMCKLRFYFLSTMNTWLHIFINTDFILKLDREEIYIPFSLLSTLNTLSIPYKFITKWKQTSPFSRLQGRIQGEGGGRTRRAPPLKLEKIRFFGVKSWFFTRNTPKIFAPPSARRNFFKCASPNLKSWIRPWTRLRIRTHP
jgi:hypothetical protein